MRFKADVYGCAKIDGPDFKYYMKNASAQEIIDYLVNRFKIGAYHENDSGKREFVPTEGYSKKEVLQLVTLRYQMNLYSYQKYIPTTVATDVSLKTVAVIMENAAELEGVAIEEDMIRNINGLRTLLSLKFEFHYLLNTALSNSIIHGITIVLLR